MLKKENTDKNNKQKKKINNKKKYIQFNSVNK